MTDLFSFLENDLPGQIPAAPNIGVGAVPVTDAASVFAKARTDVLSYLSKLFLRYGLREQLARWAYDTIVEGASGTELVQRLYDRPEFRQRFAPIFELQQKFPGIPAISPQEVLTYERDAAALMRAAGMPPQFYDHYTDFHPQIVARRSINELAGIINEAYGEVASAPRAVRDSFAGFFGPSGDAALAAFFLHPEKALPALRLQVQAAGVAGTGFNFGFTLGKERALEAASAGFGMENAADRWVSLVQSRPLFDETITEKDDLRAEEEGAAAIFGLSGGGAALTQIERRREQRLGAFSGGGGAAGSARAGARGLGEAE